MCGIFGTFNRNNQGTKYSRDSLNKAIISMNHRGPDAQCSLAVNDNVFLGHLRLAIVDLSPESNQPFVMDGRYYITFNGEIYNYLEIKKELIDLGYVFHTSGDTEVLLMSYIYWGENCVNRFNGMWAFAIYDKEENKLFCSRDRFGVKPFDYTLTSDNNFIFASEIKAILEVEPSLRKPNYNTIANFCRTSVGAQIEETWFENILRLMPAHNLVVTKDVFKIYKYWDYPMTIDENISFDDAKEQYKNLFIDAVKLRMRSDVPVGTTLSSGIDSNSIVYTLRTFFQKEHNVYTAYSKNEDYLTTDKVAYRDNKEINEIDIVNKVARELNLTSHPIEINYENDYVKKLTKIIYHLECGHNSPAVFPLSHLLGIAKNKVTVLLEGQGADELIAGYVNMFLPSYILDLLKKGSFYSAYKEFKVLSKLYSMFYSLKLFIRNLDNPIFYKIYSKVAKIDMLYAGSIAHYKHMKSGGSDTFKSSSLLNTTLHYYHTGILTSLIHYGDAISMQHSIESRFPFMDYRLVEFVFQLPNKYKIQNGIGKYIHRQAMKGILNEDIINQPIKYGFNTPLSKLFLSNDKDSCVGILLSIRCLQRGLFDEVSLRKIIKKHQNNKAGYANILFRLLTVELWFRTFIDCNKENTLQ